MKKRMTAILLAIMLALSFGALAEGITWNCPNCGQTGNTGNFCPSCATARPSMDWICPNCGQAGNTGNFCTNCGTARPAWTQDSAMEVQGDLEQIPGETDRVKITTEFVDASSYIVNKQNPSLWEPANAADGNETTCWQFSATKGLNGKSWLDLFIGGAKTVDEVWFKNGFWAVNSKGNDQYVINARLKGIRISFLYDGGDAYRDPVAATLLDESRNGWQGVPVGRHDNVVAVRIEVISTYQGSHYKNDVCLSEVMLVQEAPAAIAMPPQQYGEAVVYESRPEVSGAGLLMKLATRSGPGTEFAEPGTFFGSNWQTASVKVLKKACDSGGVWWVQVDFDYGSYGRYRVWTGLKRVDVRLEQLQEEKRICGCDIMPTTDTRYGPGTGYAKAGETISRYAYGDIYQSENGYVDVVYWYEDDEYDGEHRAWIPESAVYNLYYGDNSGEN